ncbi:FecR family protein [Filimonas effusa]|nr:FecR domain-containing protein [Filimonas effusa]
MARCLSGEASVAEREELMQCISEDITVQQQYEIMSGLWQEDIREQPLRDEDVSEEEQKNVSRILQMAEVQQAMEKEDEGGELIERTLVRRPSRVKRIIFITSGIAATILGIWLFGKETTVAPPADNTQVIVAQKGTRTQTILPDGSVVWLNAGSKITYRADFEGPMREVKLEGEAYFDVKKEKAKPFIVHANGINIKVLGTAFNVKSYPSDKTVETTLIRGLVQLSREGNTTVKPIYLHPDEKIIVNRTLPVKGNNAVVAQVESRFELVQLDTSAGKDYIETAWMNNRLAFHGDSFEVLAQKLERWYNVTIIFEDEEVKQLNFNGSFENETVGQAFKALAVATSFTFKIKGHEIYVGSAK